MRRTTMAITGAMLSALLVLGAAGTASAVPTPPGPGTDDGAPGPAAQITIVGTAAASPVNGEVGTAPVDPTAYPAAPAQGTDENAAIIRVRDALDPTQPTTDAYCVNLRTNTYVGTEYHAADWSGNVANPSYIIYILRNYYPLTNLPDAASVQDRVAAVQSAIWYFSDGFVLTDARPQVRTLTEGIVLAAIRNGSTVTPPVVPTLAIDPSSSQAPSDTREDGPFQVQGTATGITIESEDGLQLYGDAARTQPLPPDAAVTSGQNLWAGQILGDSGSFTLSSDFEQAVGTLYLADIGANERQKIVLAQNVSLPVRASATATVFAANSATLRKTITGTAAGLQGEVRVELVCDQAVARGTATTLTVPAGAAAGTYQLVVTGIPVGAVCRAVERADGQTSRAVLTSSVASPASITIPEEGPSVITVTDTYAPGRLAPTG